MQWEKFTQQTDKRVDRWVCSWSYCCCCISQSATLDWAGKHRNSGPSLDGAAGWRHTWKNIVYKSYFLCLNIACLCFLLLWHIVFTIEDHETLINHLLKSAIEKNITFKCLTNICCEYSIDKTIRYLNNTSLNQSSWWLWGWPSSSREFVVLR